MEKGESEQYIEQLLQNPDLDMIERVWKIHKKFPRMTPHVIALKLGIYKTTSKRKEHYCDEGLLRKSIFYVKKYNYLLEKGYKLHKEYLKKKEIQDTKFRMLKKS